MDKSGTCRVPDMAMERAHQTARQEWMRVLAQAARADLEAAWAEVDPQPSFEYLRRPECGLALVRGRIGGSGPPFNLGEMTISRCTVQLKGGRTGTAYVAGTDLRRAELAAVLDALLQDPGRGPLLQASVIAKLARDQEVRRRAAGTKAAATRVEFFTLVRGNG